MDNYISPLGDKIQIDEIKDCPCCGGSAKIVFIKSKRKGRGMISKQAVLICCNKCNLNLRSSSKEGYERAANVAVGRWNLRI